MVDRRAALYLAGVFVLALRVQTELSQVRSQAGLADEIKLPFTVVLMVI